MGIIAVALIGKSRVIHLPDAVAFDQMVSGTAPKFDGVAEAHRVAGAVLARFPVLQTAADPREIAVADSDALGVAAAESVRRAVADGESVIRDVVLVALIDDVTRER